MSSVERVDGPPHWIREPFELDFARIDTREAAATNWAELMTRLDGLGYQLQRAFTLLEERTQQMLEQGTRAEPVLQPHVQAALVAWQNNKQGEAPLPRPVT